MLPVAGVSPMFLGIVGESLGYQSPSSFLLAPPTRPGFLFHTYKVLRTQSPLLGLKWNRDPGCQPAHFNWDVLGNLAYDIGGVFLLCVRDNFCNYQQTHTKKDTFSFLWNVNEAFETKVFQLPFWGCNKQPQYLERSHILNNIHKHLEQTFL